MADLEDDGTIEAAIELSLFGPKEDRKKWAEVAEERCDRLTSALKSLADRIGGPYG